MRNNTHRNLSSWLNLDILYAQCYNCIIGKWRKYQYSHCAYLKRLIYFQWNMHIHISIGNSVIYTPYLSLTIWHDLLTSIIYWISRPEKWINIQHNNIKCKRNRNSLFRKTVTPLTLIHTTCLFFMFFSFKMRIKIIGFP